MMFCQGRLFIIKGRSQWPSGVCNNFWKDDASTCRCGYRLISSLVKTDTFFVRFIIIVIVEFLHWVRFRFQISSVNPLFFSVSVCSLFPFQISYFTRLNFLILANVHCQFSQTFISKNDIKMQITLTVPLPQTLSAWARQWVYIYLIDILSFP